MHARVNFLKLRNFRSSTMRARARLPEQTARERANTLGSPADTRGFSEAGVQSTAKSVGFVLTMHRYMHTRDAPLLSIYVRAPTTGLRRNVPEDRRERGEGEWVAAAENSRGEWV